MPIEVMEAMEYLSTLVREELCDNNFELGRHDMVDWVAQAYECCEIVDDFIRVEYECEA
tara:strand:+ start:246 stop:422 length:177 start_codon:yes stop_codon:yes gene_type:complete